MPGGRHQIGIPADFNSESVAGFLSECLAGFLGIRTVRFFHAKVACVITDVPAGLAVQYLWDHRMERSRSASKAKSARENVPSVRLDLSKTGMYRAMSFSLTSHARLSADP